MGRRRIKSDDEIAPAAPIPGRDFELLPVLAIFGPNASGKSNVLRALSDLLRFMTWGESDHTGQSIVLPFKPFQLNLITLVGLTRFRVRIAAGNQIFIYCLTLDQSRIHHERLECIPVPPKRIPRKPIYERSWSEADQEYVWSNGSTFGSTYRELQNALRSHEPFISYLISRLNVPIMESLASWLLNRWSGWEITDCEELAPQFLASRQDQLLKVTELIRRFDTGIARIEMKPDTDAGDLSRYHVFVLHDVPNGRVQWALNEESTGTQRLFAFSYFLLDCLENGSLLAIDELSANIHPLITRRLVQMFQSVKTNPKRAQLIFTSHDNTLQRNSLLRRDEIWFTEKRRDGSTDLYPLSDFHPRNDLAIDKAYLDGRFGAVPLLEEDEDDELVGAGN